LPASYATAARVFIPDLRARAYAGRPRATRVIRAAVGRPLAPRTALLAVARAATLFEPRASAWYLDGVTRRVLAHVRIAALLALAGSALFGACETAPDAPAATLVAGPVAAPPLPAEPTLTQAPEADAGAAESAQLSDASDADAVRAAWIAGPLRGRDNDMARLREARITTRANGTYEVFVKNQFAFHCTLGFGAEGRPARFERCRSDEAGWRASPSNIAVTCTTTATDEICEGAYRLLYPSGGGNGAALRIVRSLTP
jgi:hypothetical protein